MIWNHNKKRFKGTLYEEMNVLCSTESADTGIKIPPCALKAMVVNRGAYGIVKPQR